MATVTIQQEVSRAQLEDIIQGVTIGRITHMFEGTEYCTQLTVYGTEFRVRLFYSLVKRIYGAAHLIYGH